MARKTSKWNEWVVQDDGLGSLVMSGTFGALAQAAVAFLLECPESEVLCIFLTARMDTPSQPQILRLRCAPLRMTRSWDGLKTQHARGEEGGRLLVQTMPTLGARKPRRR
jgi:hypothetical protein